MSLDARGTDGSSDPYLSSPPTSPGPVCSDDVDRSHKNGSHIQSELDTISCDTWYEDGVTFVSNENYELGKDTLEAYVDHCYASAYPAVFAQINNAVSGINQQVEWLSFRDWLFNVLYLNLDTSYYCEDANALISTFNYVNGPRGYDGKGEMAVYQYLATSGKCPTFEAAFQKEITAGWNSMYSKWRDTVSDSILTPFDSTLPTLQQIGFELLLGPQYAAVHRGILPSSVLGNIGISPNPFIDNTVVDYTLNVPATLTVEVFNSLGERVAAPVPSVFTNNGDYSLTVSGSALASGTYYVRFAVPEGEVRTIMITKQ